MPDTVITTAFAAPCPFSAARIDEVSWESPPRPLAF